MIDLANATYGDASKIICRWQWETVENPLCREVKVFGAKHSSMLVGATVRLPFVLELERRQVHTAFSVNSMVHPDFRRLGIMESLYYESLKHFPVLFSKGTMPGMYKLLLKIGYQPLLPNTTLTSVLAPMKWIGWRTGIYHPVSELKSNTYKNSENFRIVKSFGDEFDEFWGRAKATLRATVVKNQAYMNWRYFQIPHRKYVAFYRYHGGTIVSCFVLGHIGSTGKIVDILWDQNQKDEPSFSIKFAKSFLKKCGFIKASCWCTYAPLRNALKHHLFVDRGETPHFSYISKNDKVQFGNIASDLHFVEGDGDAEYLT